MIIRQLFRWKGVINEANNLETVVTGCAAI